MLGQTSVECSFAGRSVGSPDELNVQWNESAGGEASTSHFSVSVSCLSAPNNSSWVEPQTGASAIIKVKNKCTLSWKYTESNVKTLNEKQTRRSRQKDRENAWAMVNAGKMQ